MLLLLTAAVLGVVVFLAMWSYRSSAGSTAPAPTVSTPTPAAAREVYLDNDGEYETDVVGESHYQDALERICGGRTEEGHEFACLATLKPEPDNPHDPNAVAVWIQGEKVGYLARPMAAAFIISSQNNAVSEVTCDALIVGGWDRGERGMGHFGVRLDLFNEDEDGEL